MSTMTVTISGGDNSSAQDSGQILAPQSLSTATSNFARINAAAVPHNSSVTATAEPSAATFDVVIDPNTYDFTKILAIILTCKLTALNANTLVPQVYVKLTNAAGSSHPLVIPLIPGQSFAYVNPAIVGARRQLRPTRPTMSTARRWRDQRDDHFADGIGREHRDDHLHAR